MALFLDTSALIKLFDPEPGSREVAEMVQSDGRLFLACVAPHEMLSAVKRKVREGRLPGERAGRMLEDFRSVFLPGAQVVAFDAEVSGQALALLARHGDAGLRVLDAIQLACCLAVPSATMVLADQQLARIARAEAMTVRLVG